MDKRAINILKRFKIDGEVLDVIPFGNGHINKTFLVTTSKNKYMFQQINSYAFHNVDDLMRNIYIVTSYLKDRGETTLEVIKTINNKLYIEEDGYYYRAYNYIDETICYEGLESLDLVEKAGASFGRFHKLLNDFDSCLIAETIPHFHDTPKRYRDLLIAERDANNSRLIQAKECLDFAKSKSASLSLITDALDLAEIPERIVHNDPKINNVLFDAKTGAIKSVIDLDTIMPGSSLYDFGDALRSLFTGKNESSRETSLLKVNLEVYDIYVKGYLGEMKNYITKKEIELMPLSVYIIAMELGIRFLEDYLKGDKYFHINFDDENLVRAKGQFALAQDVLNNLDKLKEITAKYL